MEVCRSDDPVGCPFTEQAAAAISGVNKVYTEYRASFSEVVYCTCVV